MKLTRAGEYAVRCVLYLARYGNGSIAKRKDIARAMEIPEQFLGKVAQVLARAGIVDIHQGVGGGFRLTRPPEQINLLEVVEAVEGPIVLNQCLLHPDSCSRVPSCSVHRVWHTAVERVRRTLEEANFADLAREENVECEPRRGAAAGK